MKILLKSLKLAFFKGATNVDVDFGYRTDIYGANEAGKTRLVDAWTFLLFGKDSSDRKDFSIKNLDPNSNPLHRVDHAVCGVISVDGVDTKLERIYHEKWTKKHGEETPVFTGHETLFFVNGVPYQMKDYQEKIESILPESLFKQLTNPLFFNSMKWTDRRAMLFDISGSKQEIEAIKANDLAKKEIAAKKKLLNESMVGLPSRIDEASRNIVPDPDYKDIEKQISELTEKSANIDKMISNADANFNEANKVNTDKQNAIYKLKDKINILELEDKAAVNNAIRGAQNARRETESKISEMKALKTSTENAIGLAKASISLLFKENNELRDRWNKRNAETIVFDESKFTCPTCRRPLEASDIDAKKEEMTASFNTSKARDLDIITNKGLTNKSEIERLEKQIGDNGLKLETIITDIAYYEKLLESISIPSEEVIPNPEIANINAEIIAIQSQVTKVEKTDISNLLDEKRLISTGISSLQGQLSIRENNKKHRERVNELVLQEKSLGQQIADLEKQEYQYDMSTREMISAIEEKVNSMFELVRFKMFNILINGGTEDVCETLIKGIPWNDANSAGRIQGGLDIIRTLSRHYDCFAPVFIDNRESTTFIPDMESQVISLYVDPSQKTLLVKKAQPELELHN